MYSRSLKSAQSLAVDSDLQLYSDESGSGKSCADLLKRSDIQAVIIAFVASTTELFPVDLPISLPITKQPEYVRLALSAGKHVLSEKPIAENVKDAQELIDWYYANIDSKKVTWSVAENFRYLDSFEDAREQVHRAGRLLGFRAKRCSMVKGGKYFGMSTYGCILKTTAETSYRNRMAEKSYPPRRLPLGWRCTCHGRPKASAGT